MEIKKQKHLDFELLLFFLLVSVASFSIYIIRHPLVLSIIKHYKFDFSPLLKAYLKDLIIYLSVLVPYLTVIVILLILKATRKIVKVKDNIMIILFFPIISFLVKTMSLMDVYINNSLIEILRQNIQFFIFLFIGPVIVSIHKIIVWIKDNRKS